MDLNAEPFIIIVNKTYMNIAEECGMSINKAKSNIMIFNNKEKIHEDNIEGIQITDTINLLSWCHYTKQERLF